MGANTPLRVNGRFYDFTSIRPSGLPAGLDASLFTAMLLGLNFKETITPTQARGVHGIPLPRGRGYYACTTSLKVTFEMWDTFTKALAAQGMDGYSDFDFDLKINLITKGKTSEIIWHESSILGPGAGWSSGAGDTLTTDLDMYTRYITTNGVCAYPLDLDAQAQADLYQALADGAAGVLGGIPQL